MSPIYDECKKMLIASEVGIVRKYYEDYLIKRRVVYRVAKSVMLQNLEEFKEEYSRFYIHKHTTGAIYDIEIIGNHIDNILIDMVKDGLQLFCDYTKNLIENWEMDRITVNKFMKSLDEFTCDTLADMLQDANKGYW